MWFSSKIVCRSCGDKDGRGDELARLASTGGFREHSVVLLNPSGHGMDSSNRSERKFHTVQAAEVRRE